MPSLSASSSRAFSRTSSQIACDLICSYSVVPSFGNFCFCAVMLARARFISSTKRVFAMWRLPTVGDVVVARLGRAAAAAAAGGEHAEEEEEREEVAALHATSIEQTSAKRSHKEGQNWHGFRLPGARPA